MDITQLVWQCFEVGIYTHSQSVELLINPDLYQLIPIQDVPLPTLCSDLLTELGVPHV